MERELAALKESNDQLRRAELRSKKYEQYYNLASSLFDDPKDSVVFIKKMVKCTHPDKNTDHKMAANAVTQTLARLLEDLRQKIG